MKEKEEAKRIIDLYNNAQNRFINVDLSKQCALIHVESLIKEIRLTVQYCRIIEVETLGDRITFLEKVKKQIENY